MNKLPIEFWSALIQAAIPLGYDLVTDILAMFRKDSTGVENTPDDWRALGTKWASKQAANYLQEAIARSGAK